MKVISPLLSHAHDGKAFYKAVMKRLYGLNAMSLAEFCEAANIDFSTAWRWKNGSRPCIDTINAVDKAFIKLENAAHTTSSTSGIKPIAIR
jgi:predicted transcriptional regulator